MIKKFSLLTLTCISFLFVGMMLPSVHATEETVSLTLNVVKLEENQVNILPTTVDIQFGQMASLDLSGLESDDDKIALLHNDTFVANDQEFLLSGSLNVSVIIKNDASDIVAAFVDSNGELLDVVYNPEEAPTTLAQPTKPGYEVGTFTTTEITGDTVFVANYVRSSTTQINVNVVDGTKDKEEYLFNDIVTVDTDLAGFTHWEDENGFVVSYDKSFKFSALNDIELTAKTSGTEQPNVYIRDVSGISTFGDSILAQIHLPDNYELIEYGFLGSNTNANNQYQPKLNDPDVVKFSSKALNAATNEFLVTIPGGGFAYTRAYMILYNSATESNQTIYSMVRNSINVTFRINYGWKHDFGNDPILGAYVRSDQNQWGLSDKMNANEGDNYTHYDLTLNHKFIGNDLSYEFKYFIYVPGDWDTNHGWSNPETLNGIEYLSRWYGDGNNNLTLSILPQNGPNQFSSSDPYDHY